MLCTVDLFSEIVKSALKKTQFIDPNFCCDTLLKRTNSN